MTKERMIELLEIEHECMLRKSHDVCDGNCCVCELVQDDYEIHEMYINVISTLKAQEPPTSESISSAIECLLHPQDADDSDMAKAIDTAVRAMRLLKAQEPDETRLVRHYSRPNVYDDLWLHCEKCGCRVDDRYRPKFCPECGRSVKWDG